MRVRRKEKLEERKVGIKETEEERREESLGGFESRARRLPVFLEHDRRLRADKDPSPAFTFSQTV